MPTVFEMLETMEVGELRLVMDAAARLITDKQEAYRKQVLEEARAKLEAAGISVDAGDVLTKSKQPRAATRKATHTYRHPQTGKDWSGRGNTPKEWLPLIPEGMGRDDKMKVLAQYRVEF